MGLWWDMQAFVQEWLVKDILKEYIRENKEVKTQEKEEKIKGFLDF